MRCSDTDLHALSEKLGRALEARGAVVATAESCTGGWIAKVLTDVPGSSTWFGTGIVAYANAAKQGLLSVPADLIDAYGAVSEPVVRAMVRGCLERSGADWAVAVSGVAGPGGGSADKPVGTVWFGVGRAGDVTAECLHFDGDRDAVRRQTVARALESLLERIGAAGD